MCQTWEKLCERFWEGISEKNAFYAQSNGFMTNSQLKMESAVFLDPTEQIPTFNKDSKTQSTHIMKSGCPFGNSTIVLQSNQTLAEV